MSLLYTYNPAEVGACDVSKRLVNMTVYSSLVESLMPQRRRRVGREPD